MLNSSSLLRLLLGLWPSTGALVTVDRLTKSGSALGWFTKCCSLATNGVNRRTARGSDSDAVRVVLESALDSIAGREKSVKTLDKIWMTGKQLGNSAYDPRSIDTISRLVPWCKRLKARL